jgi:hypothetical protein
MTAPDPVAIVTTAINAVGSGMYGVAVPALAVGAGTTAIVWAWSYFRKLGKAK